MMTIQDIIESRGIERIVHFTTNLGALGVLATRSLKARARLRDDELLANVAKLNAKDRSRDAKWHDFVNLSITNINTSFFGASTWEHRDKDYWWCILAFDPVIITHPGVWFATTCRIPDDCIDSKRYPLFIARAVLKELIESLQSTQGVKPC